MLDNILIRSLESIHRTFSIATDRHVESYVAPETGGGKRLACRDGSLISLIQWHGSQRMLGDGEVASLIDRMSMKLGSAFRQPGFNLDLVFINHGRATSGTSATALKKHFAPLYAGARRLNLNVDDLLDERVALYQQLCSAEEMYLVIWTRPPSVEPEEWKRASKKQRDETKGNQYGEYAQNYDAAAQALEDGHSSMTQSILNELHNQKQSAAVMTAHEALAMMRRLVDEEFTAADWSAILPGDPILARANPYGTDDISDIQWPRLAGQLIPREPIERSLRAVQIGDRIYSSTVVTRPASTTAPFTSLFEGLRKSGIPYRLLLRLTSAGLKASGAKGSIAGALTLGSSQNKQIDAAFKHAKALDKVGIPVVGLQMLATTWAPAGEYEALSENLSKLARNLQSWGGQETTEKVGNPLSAALATIPAMTSSVPAPMALPKLSEALEFFPWNRAASPWPSANMVFRTLDGKPYNYASMSSVQNAWVGAQISPMGGGKSVLQNCLKLGLILDPANEDLPMIRTLDIGVSSSGVPSLLQQALPPSKAHRAQYHRLQMDERFRWNPFDLPHGCRMPLPAHLAFLVSLVSIMCSPLGEKPDDGIDGLARFAIESAYRRYADTADGYPKRYSLGTDEVIDEEIIQKDIEPPTSVSWYELGDLFMAKGLDRLAGRCYRQAVPNLPDLTGPLNGPDARAIYKGKSHNGMDLPDYMVLKIKEAVNAYPILGGPTVFALDDAAIVAIDLQDVAPRGTEAAKRQTTVMYLTALWQMASEFFVGEEILPLFPERFREYHANRLSKLSRVPRQLDMDELHRVTGSSPEAVETIRQIVAEGRKWKIGINLASQRWQDFPESIRDLLTSVWILMPPQGGARKMAEEFGFSDYECLAMDSKLNGPVAGLGANLVVRHMTKQGTITHLLSSTCGGIELWANSTTNDDRVIREKLYREFGDKQARLALAKRYPGGSIQSEQDRRKQLRILQRVEKEVSVAEEIYQELRRDLGGV